MDTRQDSEEEKGQNNKSIKEDNGMM